MTPIPLTDTYVANLLSNQAVVALIPTLIEIRGHLKNASKGCSKCGAANSKTAAVLDRARKHIISLDSQKISTLKSVLGIHPDRQFVTYVSGHSRSVKILK